MRRPKAHYRHMNPRKAAEIRRLYFSRQAKQVEIARRFELAQSTVSRVISGMVWCG